MKYIQVTFNYTPDNEAISDILSAQLAEIGFESFVPGGKELDAYVPADLFSVQKLDVLLSDFPVEAVITYACNEIEDKNWNEEWEKNYFRPIVIDEKLCIHSSFHHPQGSFEYRILIDPKMAFGTGHHQTTGLILKEILKMDLNNKSVLDMGCGTAVLAILASMKRGDRLTPSIRMSGHTAMRLKTFS
jgi:Ribosomal protein L11 methylase